MCGDAPSKTGTVGNVLLVMPVASSLRHLELHPNQPGD